MISSKQLLIKTGISRATLNNYINFGLLSKPLVVNPGQEGGGARQLGYFSDDAIDRVAAIQRLKQEGLSMPEIVSRLTRGRDQVAPAEFPGTALESDAAGTRGGGPRLTIDDLQYPAYMVNYNLELLWFNRLAQETVFCELQTPPATSENRNVLRLLLETNHRGDVKELLRFHVSLAKGRMSSPRFSTLCQGAETENFTLLQRIYEETDARPARPVVDALLEFSPGATGTGRCTVYASSFREGIFLVFVPADTDLSVMLSFLAQRDKVIRDLLRRRLPVLTHLAVLVADMQSSVQICSELPAEEYFELINQIWGAMEPIFRKYYGTRGKHVGDGMVYYFFPQPDSDYLFNALLCAQQMKLEMQKISKAWQLRKNWLNELYLNTGITEGQEWLGTFQTCTSVEFVVLGDTINQAARISDFARHGAIWASKGLIGKLPAEERNRVRFGVRRKAADNREILVPSSFSTVASLVDLTVHHKLRDIAALPMTEVLEVAELPRAM